MKRSLRMLVLASAFLASLLLGSGRVAAQDGEDAAGADAAASSEDGAAPAAPQMAVEEEALDEGEEVDSAEFSKRLLTVEEKVNSLKEQVFRSKATLQLLKEIVIQGSTSGARAVLWHVNELGSSYSIQSINYFLDGQSIYAKTATDGSLDSNRQFKLHDGAIPAGNHTVAVSMVLKGNGFGIFSYVDRYTFNVQSSYAFTVEDGKTCEVWVRLKERKGIGRTFIERPWVDYDLNCTRSTGRAD